MDQTLGNSLSPHQVVASLTSVLNSLPDDPRRKIATLHACSAFLEAASLEMLPQADARLSADVNALSAKIEQLLAEHHLMPAKPDRARTSES